MLSTPRIMGTRWEDTEKRLAAVVETARLKLLAARAKFHEINLEFPEDSLPVQEASEARLIATIELGKALRALTGFVLRGAEAESEAVPKARHSSP